MRRGFILPVIILAFIAGMGYYLFLKYSRSPNQTTLDTAQSVYKYPHSDSWQVQPHHNVCLQPQAPCDQPVDVIFSTNDSWPTIYNYYKSYLVDYGWATNSTVYTSIPTSIVFDKDTCEISLGSDKPLNFLSNKTPTPPYKYILTVICQ